MKLRILVVSLMAAGCAFAQSAPVVDVTNASLEQRVATLERMLKARNASLARLQGQVDQLQDELNSVRGENETHAHKLSQLLERQRELYQELDKRTSQTPQQAVQPLLSETQAVEQSSSLDENAAYDRAVNLILKDKRYDQAIPEFRAFIAKYPNSAYIANAHYWLGQLLFNKNNFKEAQQEFEQVVNFHVDSSKRPDALSKLAIVAQKLGNNARAVQLYQQVIAEYPDSLPAKLAEPRLKALSKNATP